MKTIVRQIWRAATLAALVLTLSGGAAVRAANESAPVPVPGEDVAGQAMGVVAVPGGLSLSDVKEALIKAYAERKWQIQESSDGQMVGHHAQGKNEATLTAKYTDKEVEIFCRGSARGGGLPVRWIENFKKDLRVFLARRLAVRK